MNEIKRLLRTSIFQKTDVFRHFVETNFALVGPRVTCELTGSLRQNKTGQKELNL